MKFEKHGGMWFWRVGRFGGTFYVTRKPNKMTWWQHRLLYRVNTCAVTVIGAIFILCLKHL
jgi:hypothetical protein